MNALELLTKQNAMIEAYQADMNAVIGQRDKIARSLGDYRRAIEAAAPNSDDATRDLLDSIRIHILEIESIAYR